MASASFQHKARTQQTSLGAADRVTSENNHRVSACFVLGTGAAIIVFAPGLDTETTVWDRRLLVATAACDAAPAQTIPQVRLCTHVSVYDAARSSQCAKPKSTPFVFAGVLHHAAYWQMESREQAHQPRILLQSRSLFT